MMIKDDFVLIVQYCLNLSGREGANLSANPLNDCPSYITNRLLSNKTIYLI